MIVKAFRVFQKGGLDSVKLYVCILSALDLLNHCTIDRWGSSNPKGYQRYTSERRLQDKRGSMLKYLINELGCFPNSIVLNVRNKIEFVPEFDDNNYSFGELNINNNDLWVIDGQHRIESLRMGIMRNKDFEDYPVIVSILELPDVFDEMLLFYLVNKRQKNVPTDLAQRHLQEMLWKKGSSWLYDLEGAKGVRTALAIEIVDILNSEPSSPWLGRIQIFGESKDETHIIKDKLLTTSISPLLKEKLFQGMPVNDLADLLIDYWNAVHRIYPECFDEPKAYTLLENPGVPVLSRLFVLVYSLCIRENHVTEEKMEEILDYIAVESLGHSNPDFRGPIYSTFWSKQHGPLIANSKTRSNRKELLGYLEEKIMIGMGLKT